MNINAYKEYRFAKCQLTSTKSEKVYDVIFEKYDRFYTYFKPYIISEFVDSKTKLMIDNLTIIDIDKTFFEEETFNFKAVLLVKDKNDKFYSYDIVIENIKFNRSRNSKQEYRDKYLDCSMYEMEIPYHTEIGIGERLN